METEIDQLIDKVSQYLKDDDTLKAMLEAIVNEVTELEELSSTVTKYDHRDVAVALAYYIMDKLGDTTPVEIMDKYYEAVIDDGPTLIWDTRDL